MRAIIRTLPERLARVSKVQARYVSLRDMPGVNVEPMIAVIERSLEAAKVAAESPDVEGQIRALRALESFTT